MIDSRRLFVGNREEWALFSGQDRVGRPVVEIDAGVCGPGKLLQSVETADPESFVAIVLEPMSWKTRVIPRSRGLISWLHAVAFGLRRVLPELFVGEKIEETAKKLFELVLSCYPMENRSRHATAETAAESWLRSDTRTRSGTLIMLRVALEERDERHSTWLARRTRP